jgi:hypothetical protein
MVNNLVLIEHFPNMDGAFINMHMPPSVTLPAEVFIMLEIFGCIVLYYRIEHLKNYKMVSEHKEY